MQAHVRLEAGRLCVRSPYSPALVDRFRGVEGHRWHAETREWSFPASRDLLLGLCDCLGVLPAFLDDPALRELAGKDAYSAVERVALNERLADGVDFLVEPYAHQRRNYCRLRQSPRWLLADEMGTGKTKPAVERVAWWLNQEWKLWNPAQHYPAALVLCPKSVCEGWAEQLMKYGSVGCYVYDGHPRVTLEATPGRAIWVTNYEMLLARKDEFLERNWQFVVLDEVHRVKNFTASTSRVVRKITAAARYVYALSGTPAPNGLEDWFGVLEAVSPGLLVDDFGQTIRTLTAFRARYCVRERTMKGADGKLTGPFFTTGYRHVPELRAAIAQVTSRVTKAECLDLPGKVFTTRHVRLEGEQARVYRDLKKDAVARLKALHGQDVSRTGGWPTRALSEGEGTLTIRNVLTEALRLLQVVGGFVPDDDVVLHEMNGKAKVPALYDVLEEAGDKQAVIWCAFKAEVAYLQRWLETNFGPAVAFTGDLSAAERADVLGAFTSGKARYFVGTSAGGEGINGLEVADLEVFYSRTFNLKDFLQMTDRLDRIGQKNLVTVVNLVAQNTVDERVAEALEKKASLMEMMLRNPEDLF